MKKVILLILALLNFGLGSFFSNAQTEVVEFMIAGETQFTSGQCCPSLLVLDGHYGKFKLILRNGEKNIYDAFWTKDANSNNIIKLTPLMDNVNAATICFTPNGNYFTIGSDEWEIIKTDFLPKSEWNSKLAEYQMTGVCLSNVNSSTKSSSSSSNYQTNSNYLISGEVTWEGEPVRYANITLKHPNGNVERFKSDMDGRFTKTLSKGKYSITVNKELYEDYYADFELDNRYNSNNIKYEIKMHKEIVAISGRVTCNGYPLSNIEVEGFDYGTTKYYKDITDDNGYYSMTVPGIRTDGVFSISVSDLRYEHYYKAYKGSSNFKGSQLCNIELERAKTYANDNSSSYNNSSSDGSAVGAVIAGAAIIGGIAAAVSSSSSGSSSSSNKSSGPEVGRRNYKNVEIVDVKYNDGTFLQCVSANVRIRNKNSYSVVVKVQCRFDVAKWDEGSYIKEVTVPAGEIRTVEIIGPQRCSYYDTRIISVY